MINISKIEKKNYTHPSNSNEILKTKGSKSSYINILFNGPQIDEVFVNTFRRVILEYIPTYAFSSDFIIINKNTSIFNNDYMKLRLSQLPILDITDKYENKGDAIIEVLIDIKNSTNINGYINFTTDDIKYYINGELQKDIYKKTGPFLIIQLRYNEEFKCKMSSKKGIGKINSIWSAAKTCFFEVLENKDIILNFESRGQIDEVDIINKGCKYINKKLEIYKNILLTDITKILENKQLTMLDITKSDTLILQFDNEDHTICNLINNYLQQHKNIKYAGLNKSSLLIDQIIIKIIAYTENPVTYIIEVIDMLIHLINEFKDKINTFTYEVIS